MSETPKSERTETPPPPEKLMQNVNCNDFFDWGCAHSVSVPVAEIEAAMRDLGTGMEAQFWAPLLAAARQEQSRPQGAAYPSDDRIAALFDACGPERAVDGSDFGNTPRDFYTKDDSLSPAQAAKDGE